MSYTLHEETMGDYVLRVLPDEHGAHLNPFEWRDTLGRLVTAEQFRARDPLTTQGASVAIPIRRSDWGSSGWHFVVPCDWDEATHWVHDTQESREVFDHPVSDPDRTREWLMAEVEEWRAWCNGEVYGWEVLTRSGEVVDSCWGYIGDEEYARDEGRTSLVWHHEESQRAQRRRFVDPKEQDWEVVLDGVRYRPAPGQTVALLKVVR